LLCPQYYMIRPSPNDISFTLFGFPTSIQPFFWLIAVLLSAMSIGDINNDMPIWIAKLFLGIVAILISILVHELGHALTFRYVFHTPSAIVLHGFGGFAIPLQHYRRGFGFTGAVANSFLSFSGPLAGFILGILMFFLFLIAPKDGSHASELLLHFFNLMIWISIFWGIFNLLPIYPMDGGQISREFFLFFFPRQGIRFSLILSMSVAATLAVLAFQHGIILVAFFCAYSAYQNYQEMMFGSFRL